MTGHRVRGVLSEDRQLLATLYQDPGNAEEPAFVHVLGLRYGVDLLRRPARTVRQRSRTAAS